LEHGNERIEALRTLLTSAVSGDADRAVAQLEALDDPELWRACAAGIWITALGHRRPRAIAALAALLIRCRSYKGPRFSDNTQSVNLRNAQV